MIDWGTGEYEITAAEIAPTSDMLVAALAPRAGEHVLDVGCGTGNASLVAARAGARVTAVDPAERLVEVARRRAASEGLDIDFAVGDATALAFADAAFDAVISVFGVIFAAPPERAAAELLRVVRPDGRILLTAWEPEGTIVELGRRSVAALAEVAPRPATAWTNWSDAGALREMFGSHARITLQEHTIAFTADSPEAMLARFADHHPIYRANRELLEPVGRWEPLLADLGDVLRDGNEDPAGFRTTSRYQLVTVRPGPATS